MSIIIGGIGQLVISVKDKYEVGPLFFQTLSLVEDFDVPVMFGQLGLIAGGAAEDYFRSNSFVDFSILMGKRDIKISFEIVRVKAADGLILCDLKQNCTELEDIYEKSYKSRKVSDIVKDISSSAKLSSIVEDTLNKLTFVSTRQRVSELKYLMNRSLSSRNGLSDYKFFVDRFGELHFHTISYGKTLGKKRRIATAKSFKFNDISFNNFQERQVNNYYFDFETGNYKLIETSIVSNTLNLELLDIKSKKIVDKNILGYKDPDNNNLNYFKALDLAGNVSRMYSVGLTVTPDDNFINFSDQSLVPTVVLNFENSMGNMSKITAGDFYVKRLEHVFSGSGYRVNIGVVREFTKL